MGGRLVGDDVEALAARGPARARSRRRCRPARSTRRCPSRPPRAPSASASSTSRRQPVDVADLEPASGARRVDLDRRAQTPSFIVTASGWAPPIPPRPAVSDDAAAQRAAEVLARQLGERLVRALEDALGADVDPRAGGHLAVHRQALPLELAERRPRSPTCRRGSSSRSARAAPTRGSGTRRPACRDWTSSVSSSPRRRSSRTIASKASQLARRAAGAAVDDEVVRVARRPRDRGCS